MATGTLTGQTIANTYKSLLKVTGTTSGGETLHATTLKVIEDGDGNPSPIQLAQNRIEIVPTANHANAFEVSQADGTQIFNINSSTPGATLTGTLGVTGNSTLTGDVSIVSASSASPTLLVKNTNDDGEPAYIQFIKDTDDDAGSGDEIVKMEFYHDTDADSLIRYGAMIVSATDVTHASPDSKIKFMTRAGGTDTETMSLVSGNVEIPDNARRKWYLEGEGNIYFVPELIKN